jgi:hypothetical protein
MQLACQAGAQALQLEWPNEFLRGSARWTAWRHPELVSQRRTFTDHVIRRWRRTDYDTFGGGSWTYHYLAVDDGRSDEALAWSVRKSKYKRFTLDSPVQVTIDHGGRLVEITKVWSPEVGFGAPLAG